MADTNYETFRRVNITDPVLKRMLLEHLMEMSKKKSTGANSFDILLRDLLARSYGEVMMLSRQPLFKVHIELREKEIAASILNVEYQKNVDDMMRYFVEHGASRSMLCSYFKITREKATELRNQFGNLQKSGRPAKPSERMRDEIQAAWYYLQRDMPEVPVRALMYELHKKFSHWTIHSLELALSEFPEIKKTLALQSYRP